MTTTCVFDSVAPHWTHGTSPIESTSVLRSIKYTYPPVIVFGVMWPTVLEKRRRRYCRLLYAGQFYFWYCRDHRTCELITTIVCYICIHCKCYDIVGVNFFYGLFSKYFQTTHQDNIVVFTTRNFFFKKLIKCARKSLLCHSFAVLVSFCPYNFSSWIVRLLLIGFRMLFWLLIYLSSYI